MLKVKRLRLIGSTHLRVALALVFFLVSSLQGTLFASAGSFGMIAAKSSAHHEMVAAASDRHLHDQTADAAAHDQWYRDGKPMSDKGCEVHCAPANAMPVNPVDIVHAVARCFEQSVPAVLADGNYVEFIRPPRQLI